MKVASRAGGVFCGILLWSLLSTAGFASSATVVSSNGYINGTPLTIHTTGAFSSTGASTLITFVSTNSPWNGLPVSISGVSDNLGNNWQVLTGPVALVGGGFPLLSAIYYVNAPATSAQHTITVTLTNGAPLVVHVFAVSGSDITGPPIYAPITDPGQNGTTDVMSQAITAPAGSVLLGWAKNQSGGVSATALSGFTLDAQSTDYLWAESQPVLSSGTYTSHFLFSGGTGWQTSVVAVQPAGTTPVAKNQAVSTRQAANITLIATSPSGSPLTYTILSTPIHGTLSGAAPNLTYTPANGYVGSDAFTFKANDGTADSNVATVSITVLPPDRPPVATDGTAAVSSGTVAPISLVATDPDGDPLIYSIVTLPSHGQLSGGTGATRTYTPAPGYVGNDSFTFRANDGTLDSNLALVTISVTTATFAQAAAVVSSNGYINATSLTAHTTAAFNSTGASTLITFLSTHSPWNGRPVSISGVSDNLGNTWQVLTGPTAWLSGGNGFPMLSAIYYVNAPATSAQHTITVRLTNGAPLVVHAFAISGSDITGPPIYAPITDPVQNGTTDGMSQAITAPAGSVLLGWAKNQSGGVSATALSGFTLDAQSTDYLWAESQPVLSSG
ncbi:MAG: Ig-like domain-containing protein, partial [Terriglobales bacterium]